MLRSTVFSTVVALFVLSCAAGSGSHIPTGVFKTELDDGNVNYIFTARASLNARNKGSRAMMQATSRDAARLLFKQEFQQNDLDRSKFKITGWEFIRRGEYCRMLGTYYPGGIP